MSYKAYTEFTEKIRHRADINLGTDLFLYNATIILSSFKIDIHILTNIWNALLYNIYISTKYHYNA